MSTAELSTNVQATPVRYLTPRVEVGETETAVWLVADMPGVATDGATVELDETVLVIEGVVEPADVEKAESRPTRHYKRRFTLSDPALFDIANIKAKMANGVLEVEIPKASKPEPRQIKIATS